jgi:hypothetical protein
MESIRHVARAPSPAGVELPNVKAARLVRPDRTKFSADLDCPDPLYNH